MNRIPAYVIKSYIGMGMLTKKRWLNTIIDLDPVKQEKRLK